MDSDKLAKIKWDCRRGMLELDFILHQFLDAGFKQLDEHKIKQFQQFLDNDDPDLYAWLMGYQKPVKKNDIEMVRLIQESSAKS